MSLDFDGDGVPNIFDRCPAEDGGGGFADNGCFIKAPAKTKAKAAPSTREPSVAPPAEPLAKLEKDAIVIREKIQFAFNKAEILPSSKPVIAAVAEVMREHPEIELLECGGHADARGPAGYNLRLTQARADAVMEALTDKKVAANRLRSAGYGESCPLDSKEDEVAYAQNRRVEFTVVARDGKPTGERGGCSALQGEALPTAEPPAEPAEPAPSSDTPPEPAPEANKPPPSSSEAPELCINECACKAGKSYWCELPQTMRKESRFEKGCARGDGFACVQAGWAYSLGEKVEELPQRALAFYERGWDLGSLYAASSLAEMLQERGGEGDLERALSLLHEGCDGRDGKSCHVLGEWALKGTGVPKSPDQAATWFIKACANFARDGCEGYVELYAKGAAKNQRVAAVFATRRALAFASHVRYDNDYEIAAITKLLKQLSPEDTIDSCMPTDAAACESSCNAGDADSCSRLGVMNLYGKGMKRNDRRAANLLIAACFAGSWEACNHGAVGLPREVASTLSYDQAMWCRAGNAASCKNTK